jgi:hypothetical protein
VSDDSDVIRIYFSEMFLELSLDCLGVGARFFHDVDESALIGQQFRVNPYIFNFLGFHFLLKNFILADIFDSSAFIRCAQVEDSFSN